MILFQQLDATEIPEEQHGPLLRHWRWLVPSDFTLLCVTRIGDAVFEAADRSVWFLDAGLATFEPVASSISDLVQRLHDTSVCEQLSGRVLVEKLKGAGLQPKAGECYTYWQAPALGGEYEPENFKVVPIQQHFDIWGPLHEQIRDMPDGTEVEIEIVD